MEVTQRGEKAAVYKIELAVYSSSYQAFDLAAGLPITTTQLGYRPIWLLPEIDNSWNFRSFGLSVGS